MDQYELISARYFIQYIKQVASNANNLERHKRRLAKAIDQIQKYIQCFKLIDLDKKGVIYPKILQNYLIQNKYYLQPSSIAKIYNKYSHQKPYLSYEDVLQALMPHSDFILVSRTITNSESILNREKLMVYSCQRETIKSLQYFTAFILSEEIKNLDQDFSMMQKITKNSERKGAILWRLLDRNHQNQLAFESIKATSNDLGLDIEQDQWFSFLYWHFHSYKQTVNRSDFMRILNIHELRKRASSACKIQQFKLEKNLFKKANQDFLKSERIKQAVADKLLLMPHIIKEEHFPFDHLNQKRVLSGPQGYSNPKNLVKYVVQRS